jgi:hypothetical protein
MRFLLLIYDDESSAEDAAPEQFAAMLAEYEAYDRAVQEAGVFVSGEGLQPAVTARTVRMRDGAPLHTDGPFAETREQLGGYYLLECADLDEATRWAARIPGARTGAVEVRPVMDYEAIGREAAHVRSEGSTA